MAVPFMLDPPPVVTQTAQTCWAAAFESWADATAELTGTTNHTGRQQLIDWFESGRGLTHESGRATPSGMTLMAGLGLMHVVPFNASYMTIERLSVLLEVGYLYLAYFRRPGAPAHAVVAYGVDRRNIYMMDPWPGRGLIVRPPNYFLTMDEGRVIVGMSLALALSRSLSRTVDGLRPGASPTSGAHAGPGE